jgi:hypothetical protein
VLGENIRIFTQPPCCAALEKNIKYSSDSFDACSRSELARLSFLDMLKDFEIIARREGVLMMELVDGSKLRLFRVNVGDQLENPLIRTSLLNTLLTGDPSSYYKARGFVHLKNDAAERIVGANRIMELSVGDFIETKWEGPLNRRRWDFVVAYLSEMEMGKRFYTLFQELHASAEGGNSVDRQILVDIVEATCWKHVPGYEALGQARRMKKFLER